MVIMRAKGKTSPLGARHGDRVRAVERAYLPPVGRTDGTATIQATALDPLCIASRFPFMRGWSDRQDGSRFEDGRAWEKTGSRMVSRNTPRTQSPNPTPGPVPETAVRENSA
jgi:hypothetical protein